MTEDTGSATATGESSSKSKSLPTIPSADPPADSLSAQRVFKKSSPNNKLTLYVSSRDLVVSGGHIDRLQGVLLVDPEYVENRKVFGQITLTFRYGREDEEVMGLKFCNEAVMCVAQLYPPHPEQILHAEPNSALQDALIKRLGPNAYPFTMEITPLAPPSVQLVPAKEYRGAPIGTSYDIRAFMAERSDEKLYKRATVRMGLRVVQRACAPPSPSVYNTLSPVHQTFQQQQVLAVPAESTSPAKHKKITLFGTKSANTTEGEDTSDIGLKPIKSDPKMSEVCLNTPEAVKRSKHELKNELTRYDILDEARKSKNMKLESDLPSSPLECSEKQEDKILEPDEDKENEDWKKIEFDREEALLHGEELHTDEIHGEESHAELHKVSTENIHLHDDEEIKDSIIAPNSQLSEGCAPMPNIITGDKRMTKHMRDVKELQANLPPPRAIVVKSFMMSDGSVELEGTLDKAIYSHGEDVQVFVDIRNRSRKTVKRIKVFIVQHVDVCMFSNGKFKNVVATEESKDGCPVCPGNMLHKCFRLRPIRGVTKNWIALEDSYSKSGTCLASTVSSHDAERNVFAIYVSYYVKIKLVVGVTAKEVSLKLPFTLMHTCTENDPDFAAALAKEMSSPKILGPVPDFRIKKRPAAEANSDTKDDDKGGT